LAWIGCGQAYLGRKLRSLFFIFFLIMSIAVAAWGFVLLDGDDPEDGIIMFYGIVFAVFLFFWSLLDVSDLCDREGLAYTGNMLDMKINNKILGMQILFITTFLLLIVLSAFLLIYDTIEYTITWTFIVLSLLLPMYVAYITFKR